MMHSYEKELNRMKKGAHHVEALMPLNEDMKNDIEQFRKNNLNTSTEWFDHRFNEKISLDEIVELLEGMPKLNEQVTVLSEGSITYYPIGKDLIKSFRNAILEQVPYSLSENGAMFLKKDVIDWMEKTANTNPMFIFRLNSNFVDDYKKLHPEFVKDEEVGKEDFFKLLAKDILEEIKTAKTEEIATLSFIVRACIDFCGFKLGKNRKVYRNPKIPIKKLSNDTLRIYLKDMKLPMGKIGRTNTQERKNIESGLNLLKKRYTLDKYNIHKIRLNKLIKQGVFD